jgi:hypothetical protein
MSIEITMMMANRTLIRLEIRFFIDKTSQNFTLEANLAQFPEKCKCFLNISTIRAAVRKSTLLYKAALIAILGKICYNANYTMLAGSLAARNATFRSCGVKNVCQPALPVTED